MGTRARISLAVAASLLLAAAAVLGVAQLLDLSSGSATGWLAVALVALVGLTVGLGAGRLLTPRPGPGSSPGSRPGAGPAGSPVHDPVAVGSAEVRPSADLTAVPHPQTPDERMERCITEALKHDRVTLAYQPVIDLTTGLLVGVEALLRLKDEDGVTIAPFEVIGVAERSGLIVDLGWRVLQLSALQGGAWRDQYGVIVPVAVNVSAVQLGSEEFPTDVLTSAARAGLPPHGLTLELTESVMLGGTSHGSRQLHELRDAGFELAIDDFGTGYASLSYLHELPASALKIDQTFVSGLPEDRRSVAIVAGVVALARHCGIACIAEGIETEGQRAHLAELGVLGQGFLLGRPGTAEAIGALIEEGRADLLSAATSSEEGAAPASTRDPVTGVTWRDPGMKELDREVARARRSSTSLVLASVRVDLGGTLDRDGADRDGADRDGADRDRADRVLIEVAVALQAALRAYDLVVRRGHDELVCAVVATPLAVIEERLGSVAEELERLPSEPTIRLHLAQMEDGESLASLVARVDAAAGARPTARR